MKEERGLGEEREGDFEPGEPLRRRRRPVALPHRGSGSEPRAPRRIHRTRRERVLGGVAGGLARAYLVDAEFVRALFVLATFVGGAGIVAYIAGLFLLPLEPAAWRESEPVPAPRQDTALVWAGLGAVALALALMTWIRPLGFRLLTLDRGALWPALLIGLSVAMVISRRREPGAAAGLLRRRLSRPRHDRLLFGVASGFARYTAIDPSLVRVTLIVIAVWSYGIGALLYLSLALFLPADSIPG